MDTHHLRASIAAVHMVVGEAHVYMLQNGKRSKLAGVDERSAIGEQTLDVRVINHPADDGSCATSIATESLNRFNRPVMYLYCP